MNDFLHKMFNLGVRRRPLRGHAEVMLGSTWPLKGSSLPPNIMLPTKRPNKGGVAISFKRFSGALGVYGRGIYEEALSYQGLEVERSNTPLGTRLGTFTGHSFLIVFWELAFSDI